MLNEFTVWNENFDLECEWIYRVVIVDEYLWEKELFT